MLLRVFSRLPLEVLYLFSDLLYLIINHVLRYRRRVVYDNLQSAFPERSPAEIRKLANDFYRHFADIVVETIKAITMSDKHLLERVHWLDLDVVREHAKRGRPVILASTHQCNWEWLLLTGCLHLPGLVSFAYRPLHSEWMDRLMLRLRSRFGGVPIPAKNLYRESLRRGTHINVLAIVADHRPRRRDEKYWTTFLNQDTAFFVGTERLARKIEVPVVFVGMKRVRRGHYQVCPRTLAEPPYGNREHAILDKFARAAEEQIKDDPSRWLWSHRRWKYEKPALS